MEKSAYTPPLTVKELLTKLNGVVKSGDGWMALCPCHDDHDPSLSVRVDKGGKVLVKCHGCGAGYREVLDEVGVRPSVPDSGKVGKSLSKTGAAHMSPLTLEDYAASKDLQPDFLRSLGLETVTRSGMNAVDVPYLDQDKNVLAVRTRFGNGMRWRRGDTPVLYGLDRLALAREEGFVFIVEGESDCHTLWQHGIPAVGVPGASTFKPEWAQQFEGIECVYLWYEQDLGAAQLIRLILSSGLVSKTKVVWSPGFKDPSEIHMGNPEKFLSLLQEAKNRAIPIKDLSHLAATGTEEVAKRKAARDFLKHNLTNMDELMRLEVVDRPDLVDGLLPTGGINLVNAKPKVGKSTLLRALVMSVATGLPFLGRATLQGTVVYLAMEEKEDQLKRAFESMGACPTLPVYFITRPLGMGLDEAVTLVEELILQLSPVLVVIDPLFRLVPARDANDYAEMTRCLEPFIVLSRAHGVCIVIAHHSRKGQLSEGGDSILGSTAILGSVDTTIELVRRKDRTRVISSIQRYGEDLAPTELVFDQSNCSVCLGSTAGDEDADDLDDRIVAFLEQNPGSFADQVVDAVTGKTQAIKKALAALAESGQASVVGTGKRGDPKRYTLA